MSDVEHWTDSRLNAAGALYTDNPHLGDLTIVHPSFHKASFKDISDADYTLIESSLRLASAYLNEPSTLSFWGLWLLQTVWMFLACKGTGRLENGKTLPSATTWSNGAKSQHCSMLEEANWRR